MQAAQDELQAGFRARYAAALGECNRGIARLRDAFDDAGRSPRGWRRALPTPGSRSSTPLRSVRRRSHVRGRDRPQGMPAGDVGRAACRPQRDGLAGRGKGQGARADRPLCRSGDAVLAAGVSAQQPQAAGGGFPRQAGGLIESRGCALATSRCRPSSLQPAQETAKLSKAAGANRDHERRLLQLMLHAPYVRQGIAGSLRPLGRRLPNGPRTGSWHDPTNSEGRYATGARNTAYMDPNLDASACRLDRKAKPHAPLRRTRRGDSVLATGTSGAGQVAIKHRRSRPTSAWKQLPPDAI